MMLLCPLLVEKCAVDLLVLNHLLYCNDAFYTQPTTLDPGSSLVQWENSVYSSLDLRKPGVYLMASDGYLYTSGWFHGALHIHRVLLPNFNGLPNWDHFLTTPDSPSFIQGKQQTKGPKG